MFYISEIIIINACGATVLVGEGERLIMDVADVKAISGYAKSAKIIASHMDTVSHKVEFSSSEKSRIPDTVKGETPWVNDYYEYTITDEKIFGKWDLNTTSTTNDSLGFIEQAPIDVERKESMGDTLSLVNKADLSSRTFKTDDETKTYELSSELGTTAAGNFSITGATDGTNTSTVDLNNKNGFNLNNATNLTLTDVKLTGANGDTVTLNNENASLKLNENAIIDGSINNISGSVDNKGSITGNVNNSGNFTNDGTITGTGTLTNSGNLINNGTISSNSITNEAGGTITSKTQDLISVSPIENNGTLNLTGASTFSNISGVASGKVNINADSSTFTLDHNIQGNELTFNGDV